jgi:hypothetical protein
MEKLQAARWCFYINQEEKQNHPDLSAKKNATSQNEDILLPLISSYFELGFDSGSSPDSLTLRT